MTSALVKFGRVMFISIPGSCDEIDRSDDDQVCSRHLGADRLETPNSPAPKCPRIPATGTRGHHPCRPEAGHVSKNQPDHSAGGWAPRMGCIREPASVVMKGLSSPATSNTVEDRWEMALFAASQSLTEVLRELVPVIGLEPTTPSLRMTCSTS